MKNLARITLAAFLAGAAAPVFSQDVVMRRPIPGAPSQPSNPQTPPDDRPPAEPVYPERYVLATPQMVRDGLNQHNCSGGQIDPDDPLEPADPGSPGGPDFPGGSPMDYAWRTGPWQGSSQCGVQTTLTRELGCLATDLSDPANPTVTEVSVEHCAGNVDGPRPETTYTGDKAGCQFVVDESYDDSTWKIPPWAPPGDTASCSDHAYRDAIQTCRNSTNELVDMRYCVENYVSGGMRSNTRSRQTGNRSGCNAEWKLVGGESYCANDRQSDSPFVMDIVDVACVKQGKRVYGTEEAACPADDRPLTPTTMQIGECRVGYWNMSYYSGTCISPFGAGVPNNPSLYKSHGTPTVEFIPIPDAFGGDWNGDPYRASSQSFNAANAICMEADASCCAIERVPQYGEMNVRVHHGEWTVNRARRTEDTSQYYGVSTREVRIEYWDVDYGRFYYGDACEGLSCGPGGPQM